jgi:hypothetical protein
MSHSVKIKTPIPSPEEIASDLGISGRRLDTLLALVERDKTGSNGINRSDASAKAAAKKSAPRVKGKRGSAAR